MPSITCNNCFLSNKFPGITFNEQQCCSVCASFQPERPTTSNLDELKTIAAEIVAHRKETGGKYDCIIGASGGLDSSYVLYVAVKRLGLTPLVVNYDSGFNHDIAQRNLVGLCVRLGVDLRIIRSEKGNTRKFIQHTILALKNIGLFWSVCDHCHYSLKAVLLREAIKEGIHATLVSYNVHEAAVESVPRKAKLAAIFKRLVRCNPARLTRLGFHMALARYYLFRLKRELSVPGSSRWASKKSHGDLRAINVTKYVEWNIPHMVEQLKELGWEYPEETALPMRFDCRIESLIDHTFKEVVGITTHGLVCNSLLLYGEFPKAELTRALQTSEEQNAIRDEINGLGKDLGIGRVLD